MRKVGHKERARGEKRKGIPASLSYQLLEHENEASVTLLHSSTAWSTPACPSLCICLFLNHLLCLISLWLSLFHIPSHFTSSFSPPLYSVPGLFQVISHLPLPPITPLSLGHILSRGPSLSISLRHTHKHTHTQINTPQEPELEAESGVFSCKSLSTLSLDPPWKREEGGIILFHFFLEGRVVRLLHWGARVQWGVSWV